MELVINNLKYSYPNSDEAILEDINLYYNSNGIIGLIGINGSGKSTLLRLIAGIYSPTSGEILLDGKKLTKISQTTPIVAFIPENAKLFLVGPTPRIDLMKILKDPEKVKEIYHRYHLTHLLDKKLYHLSEGQRRLVALIHVFQLDRELILLDEPTIGLDKNGKEIIASLLNQAKSQGKTVLISTNDGHLFRHFEEVIVLNNKTVVLKGRSSVLFELEEHTSLKPNQTVDLINQLNKDLALPCAKIVDPEKFSQYLSTRISK